MRTARGRIATNMAYLQFGMTPPEPKWLVIKSSSLTVSYII